MNSQTPPLPAKADCLLANYARYAQSPALLLIRLGWGWELYLSGYRHLHIVPAMVERFTRWGVPLPHLSVYISGVTELVGGALLFLGLATRWVSLPLIFNFIVAFATASRGKLAQAFGGPDHLEGLENLVNDDAFPMLAASLLLLAFGPGRFSLDYLLGRFVMRDGGCCGMRNDPLES